MANFPGSIKTFVSKVLGDVLIISDVNELQDEVNAVETYLGVNPQGTASTVASRLDYIEANNLLMNSAMLINQENGFGSTITSCTNGAYLIDNFQYYRNFSGSQWVHQMTHEINSLINGDKSNASSYISLLATTPKPSLGVSDHGAIRTFIEKSKLGPSPDDFYTLSFYVRSNTTGTFCIAINEGTTTNSYIEDITINSAETWEEKYFTFQFNAGFSTLTNTAWQATVNWVYAAASARQAPTTGIWYNTTATYLASANIDNFVGNTNASFLIAMPKLQAGKVKTMWHADDPSIDLQRCQRLYYTSYPDGSGVGAITSDGSLFQTSWGTNYLSMSRGFPSKMRVTPSCSVYNPVSGSISSLRGDSSNYNATVVQSGQSGIGITADNVTIAANVFCRAHVVADARF